MASQPHLCLSWYEFFNFQQSFVVFECVQFSSKTRLRDEKAHHKLALHSEFVALFDFQRISDL